MLFHILFPKHFDFSDFFFLFRVLGGPGFESGVSRNREGDRGAAGAGGGVGGGDREGGTLKLDVDDTFRTKR